MNALVPQDTLVICVTLSYSVRLRRLARTRELAPTKPMVAILVHVPLDILVATAR